MTDTEIRRALTAVEDQALDFIKFYIEQRRYPPTVAEIAEAISRSGSSTHRILRNLQTKGWLVLDGGPRMLRVVE